MKDVFRPGTVAWIMRRSEVTEEVLLVAGLLTLYEMYIRLIHARISSARELASTYQAQRKLPSIANESLEKLLTPIPFPCQTYPTKSNRI